MQLWRFLTPAALGFTLKNAAHALIDKITGAPPRVTQAAEYVARHARLGVPESVLHTLDRFALEERWLMSVGPEKGPLVSELAERLPDQVRVLELGAYCGYSAILIAHTLGQGATVVSIEVDAAAVASARRNVGMAGLSRRVSVQHGPSSELIPGLGGQFDLVFLDHWKDLYKKDLQLIEERRLLKPGGIVVADNVGAIFNPDEYLEYVRGCGRYRSEHRLATIEYTSVPDAVEISVYRP